MKTQTKRHSICDSDKVISCVGPISLLKIVALYMNQHNSVERTVNMIFGNKPSTKRLEPQGECQTLACALTCVIERQCSNLIVLPLVLLSKSSVQLPEQGRILNANLTEDEFADDSGILVERSSRVKWGTMDYTR